MFSQTKTKYVFFIVPKRRKRSTTLPVSSESQDQVRIHWISASRVAPRLAPKPSSAPVSDADSQSPSINSRATPSPGIPSNIDIEDIEDGDKKKKKARTTFTGKQIFELEKQFETKKYLSSNERMDLARTLNVTETQVSFNFVFIFLFKLQVK